MLYGFIRSTWRCLIPSNEIVNYFERSIELSNLYKYHISSYFFLIVCSSSIFGYVYLLSLRCRLTPLTISGHPQPVEEAEEEETTPEIEE